ncbi:uncharacterized protein LOC124403672 [Silurus meridionalis]|uniref:uncharacterized protein LOC124403672 n=1 Tax=Silurus meridionalis TaxID=175797 RepID=UPI001EE9BE7E|nr:uncharacterized protein LOC124403672 [Silurus meridionalis]
MNSNTDKCHHPPYVYNSSSNTKSDFEFTGDDKSDCTLLIHNVQFSYSGVYKFRFITDVTGGRWTGDPGVTLQVTDLKVSLIRLSGNGTFKPGDSLNLTCDVTCTQSSSQFVWSKNNELLPESGAVLHFPALTLRDSGKYTCTWKTSTTSGSKTISLQVEDKNLLLWPICIIVLVATGLILVFVIHSRRCVHFVQLKKDDSETFTKVQLSGNGTFKPGDSLNLTCDVTCTQSSSQFVWSKNNELLPESGAVLHFPALTLRDSGNYTCTWKTSTTSGSKTISLQVEEPLIICRFSTSHFFGH